MYNTSTLQSVGVLPDNLRSWALTLALQSGVSFDFALFTLLGGMSAATCGLKSVRRPDDGTEPTALIVFAFAPSRYGKTRVHKRAFKPHHEVDQTQLANYMQAGSLKARHSEGRKSGNDEVEAPRLRLAMIQDVSKFGLLEALEGIGESGSMTTDEGNLVLRSNLFANDGLEIVTKLWDGEGTVQLRRKNRLLIAMNSVLSTMLMVQPDVWADYERKHGKHARSVGFYGRGLFVCARSWDANSSMTLSIDPNCLQEYDAKVHAFLSRKLEMAGIEAMTLSPEAEHAFFGFQQQLSDAWSSPMHAFMQDAVGRAMQNVIRIAGLIQAFVDENAPISAQAMFAGFAIVQFSLVEFSRIFAPEPVQLKPIKPIKPFKLTVQQRTFQRQVDDCRTILKVIYGLCSLRDEASALLSEVRDRCGIYPLRFRAAFARLVDEGSVLLEVEGKEERVSIKPADPSQQLAPSIWASQDSL